MIPAPIQSAAWMREVAVMVIERLLNDELGPEERMRMADQLMEAGERAAIERDGKLREIAKNITREMGFEEPPQ